MADEVAKCSNHDRFVVCFCWVDKDYEAHEDFVSIYKSQITLFQQ